MARRNTGSGIRRRGAWFAAALLVLSGCTAGSEQAAPAEAEAEEPLPRPPDPLPAGEVRSFPPAPEVPAGPLDETLATHVDELLAGVEGGTVEPATIDGIIAAGDVRVGWLLADILRVAPPVGAAYGGALRAATELTGVTPRGVPWVGVTDHLIAWDLPDWPSYRQAKARVYLQVEPAWEPFFADADADIDWRLLSWGGVLIDDRPFPASQPCPRGCIPALDDPAVTDAADGDWYPDDRIVFGVIVDGEALALPRNQMEIHEMANVELGGRRLGIPYCTLCGSAQAYLTDDVPAGLGPAVLRTSGLLSRSNKVMYDLETMSAFDTFTGRAVSGPLHDAEVTLEQVTVVASTWGEWRRAHPDTRILAVDGGTGRSYPLDPLRGRDDDGPIFPIGQVDPRLPIQELVVGSTAPDGTPVAFPAAAARAVLEAGGEVAHGGLVAQLDGSGLRLTVDGDERPTHQAFWFAWSQFHPDTELWLP